MAHMGQLVSFLLNISAIFQISANKWKSKCLLLFLHLITVFLFSSVIKCFVFLNQNTCCNPLLPSLVHIQEGLKICSRLFRFPSVMLS